MLGSDCQDDLTKGCCEPSTKSSMALWAGAGLVVIAAFLFASHDAIAKTLSKSHSPFQVAWLRFLLHAIIVGAWLYLRGHHRYLYTQKLQLHSLRALALVLVSVSMYWAVSLIPLSLATAIQFLSPIIVTLISVVYLRERIGWRRSVAIVFGFLGVVIVIAPGVISGGVALLIPLFTACALAIYVLLTRQLSAPSEALPAIGLMPIICALILSPIMPFVWQSMAWQDLPLILVMAVFGAMSHICLQIGLGFASASVMAPFLYSQVVWATLLGVLFYSDPIGLSFVLGASIIVGSGVAIWWFGTDVGQPETAH